MTEKKHETRNTLLPLLDIQIDIAFNSIILFFANSIANDARMMTKMKRFYFIYLKYNNRESCTSGTLHYICALQIATEQCACICLRIFYAKKRERNKKQGKEVELVQWSNESKSLTFLALNNESVSSPPVRNVSKSEMVADLVDDDDDDDALTVGVEMTGDSKSWHESMSLKQSKSLTCLDI